MVNSHPAGRISFGTCTIQIRHALHPSHYHGICRPSSAAKTEDTNKIDSLPSSFSTQVLPPLTFLCSSFHAWPFASGHTEHKLGRLFRLSSERADSFCLISNGRNCDSGVLSQLRYVYSSPWLHNSSPCESPLALIPASSASGVPGSSRR